MRVSISQLKRIIRETALRENEMGGMPPMGSGMSEPLEAACAALDALEEPLQSAIDAVRDARNAMGGMPEVEAVEEMEGALEGVKSQASDVSYTLSNLARTSSSAGDGYV